MTQLKKELNIHIKDIATKLLIPVGIFVLGVIMVLIIMATESSDETWFCMGTLLALIFTVLINVIIGFSYYSEFMLALSMGRTRKEFILTYALRQLVIQAIGYLIVLLLHQAELALYSVLYPTQDNEYFFSFLTQWWMILLAIPGATLLHMFLGAMYCRFGKKTLPVFYIVWFGLCILGPKAIPDEDHTGILAQMMSQVYRWVIAVPGPMWIALITCVTAAMAFSIVYLGRKQMVH